MEVAIGAIFGWLLGREEKSGRVQELEKLVEKQNKIIEKQIERILDLEEELSK